MKILFLTRRFWPEIGGVEKHVFEVAKRLVEIGYEVTVVSEEVSVSSTSEESRQLAGHHQRCLKAYYIPVRASEKFKKFQIWWWMWKNRKLIKEADIVHAHDVGFWYWPFRFLYPKKPCYITFHGWEGKFPIPLKNKIVRKISEKLAWKNICVGDYIGKWYGMRADEITYGGVSFSPSPRRSAYAHPRGVFIKILFVGRLEGENGIKTYFQVLDMLKEKGIEFKITFLGQGTYGKEATKYGVVKLVHFDDIYHYSEMLKKSDFVFASSYLSILEAMAAKKLVFAVFVYPLKEDYLKLTPFSKWIIIESSAEALYHKLVYYTQHPEEEEKLVNKAYDWVKEQTWKKVVEIYLKLWKVRT